MKIFITGGSSGIGAAIVDLLSKDGHEVTFTYFKNKNSHSDLKNCKGLFFDLNSEDSLKEITEHIKTSEYDALVNNLCTVPAREKFLKMQPSDFMDYILINLKSALLLSQVFSESLKKRSNCQYSKFGNFGNATSRNVILHHFKICSLRFYKILSGRTIPK